MENGEEICVETKLVQMQNWREKVKNKNRGGGGGMEECVVVSVPLVDPAEGAPLLPSVKNNPSQTHTQLCMNTHLTKKPKKRKQTKKKD